MLEPEPRAAPARALAPSRFQVSGASAARRLHPRLGEGRRAAIEAAEAKLKADGLSSLGAGQLRSIIESRTGHGPKATSNKIAEGETEGAPAKKKTRR